VCVYGLGRVRLRAWVMGRVQDSKELLVQGIHCNTKLYLHHQSKRRVMMPTAHLVDVDLAVKMKEFIETTMKTLQMEVSKSKELNYELTLSKRTIEDLGNQIKVLEAAAWIEQDKKRAEVRQAKRRETYTKKNVSKVFGGYDVCDDSPLFNAAAGFMMGSQLKNHSFTEDAMRDKPADHRSTDKVRKSLLAQMVTHMFEGEIGRNIERAVLKRKRFSTVQLVRVSDIHSTFNASAVGSIAKCEGGKVKGEMGLLCSETTMRRTMDLVHDQAVQLGFSYMPEDGLGKVWCWGEQGSSILQKAVNLYVKTVYHDSCCKGVSEDCPFIVPLTGDAVRTSQRGTVITVMGAKQSDSRLQNQDRAGQSLMCQSCDMYTPAVAGFASESEVMEYFHALVREFRQIETQGFCMVNGHVYKVHIEVVVVADLSFLQKYVRRGGGSHSTTCFCMMCSAFRNFWHEGYSGGCWKCRARGTVYGRDGLQRCKHHDACTPEFLAWQTNRYSELCDLVPEQPLSVLPAWESVDQLRRECIKRCVGEHVGELENISRLTGPKHFTGQDLSNCTSRRSRRSCNG
jgi:hypothetical protein